MHFGLFRKSQSKIFPEGFCKGSGEQIKAVVLVTLEDFVKVIYLDYRLTHDSHANTNTSDITICEKPNVTKRQRISPDTKSVSSWSLKCQDSDKQIT